MQALNQKTTLERQNLTLEIIAEYSRLSNLYIRETDFLEKSLQILVDRTNLDYVSLYLLSNNEDVALQTLCFETGGKKIDNFSQPLNVEKSDFSSNMTALDSYNYKLGTNNYFIDQPNLLPNMSMSISTPLSAGSQLLGLVNIQAIQAENSRINQNELQAISDQLALSLQNIRLVSQLQERVDVANRMTGLQTHQSWDKYLRSEALGYQYDRIKVVSSEEKLPDNVRTGLLNKQPVVYKPEVIPPRSRLVVPIIIREKVIGLLGYDHIDVDHYWLPDEISLLETLASRVSLALDNTRLVAESQSRAERERNISQMSSNIRSTLDIQTVLKTAVRELKMNLDIDAAEVRLHLENKNNQVSENKAEDAG